MKSLQGIRTKLNGKYLPIAVAVAGLLFSISVAILFNHYEEVQAQKAENEIVLSKDKWHCFAGMLNDNSDFECMVYKRKDVNFGAHSSPRQREYDKKQGTSIHSVQ